MMKDESSASTVVIIIVGLVVLALLGVWLLPANVFIIASGLLLCLALGFVTIMLVNNNDSYGKPVVVIFLAGAIVCLVVGVVLVFAVLTANSLWARMRHLS